MKITVISCFNNSSTQVNTGLLIKSFASLSTISRAMVITLLFTVSLLGQTAILTEGFESGSIPVGWASTPVSGSDNWAVVSSSPYTPTTPHSGTYFAILSTNSFSVTTRLISPEISLPDGATNDYKLVFWYSAASIDYFSESIKVYYKTSEAGSWTLINTFSQYSPGWTSATVILPNPSATYYLAFEGLTYSISGGVTLDDISLTSHPKPVATAPASGSGTSGSPYQIASLENLYWIASSIANWDKHYIQTANIDASATATWANFWTPIGAAHPNRFTGSYNGQNFTISNLTVNLNNNYAGLFGQIYNATVQNVGMVNASVSGKDDCGGLAGRIVFSSVTNCYSTGSVTGVSYIGGLVGDSYSGTITNCYSTATVSGTTYSGGGLVGQNNTDAIIRNSYATGNVSGFTQGAGGLVGNNHTRSTISNSYSTGNVSGRYAGGFAGINSSNSSITNCYSTGSVTSNSNYGGFIGFMNTSTEPGCFWDTETSLQSTTLGEAVGKSTSEMKNYVTYFSAQWDFKGETAFGTDDLWNIGNSRNNGYPYLNWQFPGDPGPQTPDPDAQPTNLTFSTSGSGPSSIIVKYSASETAQNYLVVRKAGSAPSFVPSNGTSYTTGTQGGDYIVYAGSGTTATDNNLSLGSSYYCNASTENGLWDKKIRWNII